MGIMATLEGEPPGEPDQRAARAHNRFSRLAGEGGRYGRMRATGPVLTSTGSYALGMFVARQNGGQAPRSRRQPVPILSWPH